MDLIEKPDSCLQRCVASLGTILIILAFPEKAAGANYEVYPGSAFYLTQMLDRSQWSFVADRCNGLYHHPVGFQTLDAVQEATYTSHFTNRFAMVEGDMGSGSTTGDVANLQLMSSLGLTPVAAFVNRPSSNLAVWKQLVRNNAAEGAPTYEMLAPHVLDNTALGWNDPIWNYARSNMGVAGCIGSGVDAPVNLFVNQAAAYRQSVYDLRDWTVANGKKFNYLISPNNSYNAALLADTQTTVRAMEDTGHEPDVYGVVLYGERPVDLTPEKVNVNGVDQAATTITGLAYWLLKHRDGEPGTLDLSAIRNGVTHGGAVMAPTLANSSQVVSLSSSSSSTFTIRLDNNSPWLDYAGVLRARAQGSLQNWTISFSKGGQDVTSAVFSENGRLFVGAERWMPGSRQELTLTVAPNGTLGPLKLILEALPHAGVDHALDVLSFESGSTGNTPPTLALNTMPQITREALPFGPLWFTCGDAETLSTSLTASATSSNTQLIPNANITFGQSGIQRWLRIVPANGQWGSSTISVTVGDGTNTTTRSFVLTVDRTTVLPVLKANNSNSLDLTTSWQGSVKPGINDQAVWDSTVTAANTVNLGADLTVAGLRITNPGGDVTIGGTATLSLGVSGVDLGTSSRNLTLNSPVAVDEAATWNINSARVVRTTQGLGSFGGITKTGGGRLELAGNDTFAGPLAVSAGELYKTGSGTQSSTTVSGNGLLRVSHSGGFGTGGLSISAANSSTGRVELSGGISVLTGKAVSINSRTSNTDAISNLSGNNTLGGDVSLSTGGSLYGFGCTSGILTLSGNLTSIASGNRNFTLRGAGDGIMTGTVTNGSGIVGIIKSGTGQWTLSGTHSFTGPVSLQDGTLKVMSPLPTQDLTESAGTTLSGVGALGGSITIAGSHAPGDGVGTQTVTGQLDYQNTARIQWEISSQSLVADRISAANVSVAPGAVVQIVANSPGSTISFADAFWRAPRQWTVLSASTLTGSFIAGTNPTDSLGKPSQPFGTFSLAQATSGVNLIWSPAPAFQVWQYEQFGNDWNNPLVAGPAQDPDGDGWTNYNEWITGTLPKNPASRFVATLAQGGITFNRLPDRTYRVDSSTDLKSNWTTYATVSSGSGPVTIPVSPGSASRIFYRIAVSINP